MIFMGRIISSKVSQNGKIIYEVALEYEESLQLEGHLRNVYLFSEDSRGVDTNLAKRGRNCATKYFLIPRTLRKNLQSTSQVKCQTLMTPTKNVFIYVVDK